MTAVEVLQEWEPPELCKRCGGDGHTPYLLWPLGVVAPPDRSAWECPRCHGTGIEPERSET